METELCPYWKKKKKKNVTAVYFKENNSSKKINIIKRIKEF